MSKPHVKLSWGVGSGGWEPVLINLNQVAQAVVQFRGVEQRHVQMICRVQELRKVLICPEGLSLTSLLVLDDIQSLVTRDTVVKASG